MRRLLAAAAAAIATLTLAGCTASGIDKTPTASPTPSLEALTIGAELEPGTYTSEVFATPVTFTVPEGWKVFEDEPGQFGLARMANDGPPLLVLRDIDGAAENCEERAEPNVGRSAEELATWLANHEGLVTTEPASTTVGGLNGLMIDTSMEPSWTGVCPFSNGQPIVMTLVGSEISQGVHWGVDAEFHDRLWVLDLPTVENGNIIVVGNVCCGVDADDQLNAAQEIIDSFSFDSTGS